MLTKEENDTTRMQMARPITSYDYVHLYTVYCILHSLQGYRPDLMHCETMSLLFSPRSWLLFLVLHVSAEVWSEVIPQRTI